MGLFCVIVRPVADLQSNWGWQAGSSRLAWGSCLAAAGLRQQAEAGVGEAAGELALGVHIDVLPQALIAAPPSRGMHARQAPLPVWDPVTIRNVGIAACTKVLLVPYSTEPNKGSPLPQIDIVWDGTPAQQPRCALCKHCTAKFKNFAANICGEIASYKGLQAANEMTQQMRGQVAGFLGPKAHRSQQSISAQCGSSPLPNAAVSGSRHAQMSSSRLHWGDLHLNIDVLRTHA